MTGPLASDRPPGEEPDGALRPGDLIAGKYKIDRVLGKGGVGVVVAARDTQLQRKVAVKFLRSRGMSFPGAKERFLREAQAAVAIQSEHVARVIEFGTLDSGAPFIVMEYLTGIDLGDVLEQNGPLPIPQAVDYVLQACEAIAEAHSLGIVHRDLKPPNLFLAERPDGSRTVKVLDFGLSTAPITSGEGKVDSLTSTDMVAGSPHFMSPEQVRSLKHVDAHTDIWALGVILYQLVSDALPFDADSVTGVIAKILTDPPMPLSARRTDVPPALEAVILRCLEKSVERRTASVAELATALEPFGSAACRLSVESIVRLHTSSRGGPLSAGTGALPAVSASTAASTLGDAARDLATTQQPVAPARPAPDASTRAAIEAPPPSTDTPPVEPADRASRGAPAVAPASSRAARVGALVALLVLAPLATLAVVKGTGAPSSPRPLASAPEAASAAPPAIAPSASAPLVTPGPAASAPPEPSATAPPASASAAPSPAPAPRPTSGALPAATGRPAPPVRKPAGKDDPLDRWQ